MRKLKKKKNQSSNYFVLICASRNSTLLQKQNHLGHSFYRASRQHLWKGKQGTRYGIIHAWWEGKVGWFLASHHPFCVLLRGITWNNIHEHPFLTTKHCANVSCYNQVVCAMEITFCQRVSISVYITHFTPGAPSPCEYCPKKYHLKENAHK